MLAPLAGLGAGVLGAFFRLALEQANRAREALIAGATAWGIGGFVLVVALAAGATALAAWLVRRVAPSASGSGIPRVMAVLDGDMAPAPLRVIPVKFLAGTLGMGAELAARIQAECFYELQAPVLRVTGYDLPYPPSRTETGYLPDLDRVLDAVDRSMAY